MRKILLSLGAIAFTAALAAGATGAFFTDTETSTGNVFTAGSIVLSVDDVQHYNNAICTKTSTDGPAVYTWQLAPGQTVQPDQFPVIGSPCTGTWDPSPLALTNFGLSQT